MISILHDDLLLNPLPANPRCESVFELLKHLQPLPSDSFQRLVRCFEEMERTDDFYMRLNYFFLLENRNPPFRIDNPRGFLFNELLRFSPPMADNIVSEIFRLTTPENLSRRIAYLQLVVFDTEAWVEQLADIIEWPIMTRSDYFLLAVVTPWPHMPIPLTPEYFALSTRAIKRALAHSEELKAGAMAAYLAFLVSRYLELVINFILCNRPLHFQGLRNLRHLMYLSSQCAELLVMGFAQVTADVLSRETPVRRQMAKLITEMVRETIGDPHSSIAVQDVMNLYSRYFSQVLRERNIEMEVVEPYLRLAMGILASQALRYQVPGMQDAFRLLNSLTAWRQRDCQLLCNFFVRVLHNSPRHLDKDEVVRFVKAFETTVCDEKLRVLTAIINAAGEAFAGTAQSVFSVLEDLDAANPGRFTEVIELLLGALPTASP
jgi:hypothetical protein